MTNTPPTIDWRRTSGRTWEVMIDRRSAEERRAEAAYWQWMMQAPAPSIWVWLVGSTPAPRI